jgi:hypothetical protein
VNVHEDLARKLRVPLCHIYLHLHHHYRQVRLESGSEPCSPRCGDQACGPRFGTKPRNWFFLSLTFAVPIRDLSFLLRPSVVPCAAHPNEQLRSADNNVILVHFRSGFFCRQRMVRHPARAKAQAGSRIRPRSYRKGMLHPVALVRSRSDAENFPATAPRSIRQWRRRNLFLTRTSPSTQLHNNTKVVIFVNQPPSP